MKDVTLKLHYNVQPWVGALTWNMDKAFGLWKAMSGGLSEVFILPTLKTKDAKTKAKTKAKGARA